MSGKASLLLLYQHRVVFSSRDFDFSLLNYEKSGADTRGRSSADE